MNRRFIVMTTALIALAVAPPGFAADEAVLEYIQRAGNVETDAKRLEIIRGLAGLETAPQEVRDDAKRMAGEIDRYMNAEHLYYYSRDMRANGRWDFGIPEDSPLWPIAQIYHARMHVWDTFEYGTYWSHPDRRRIRFDEIRPVFEELAETFPENRLLRMYLGEGIPAPKEYPPAKNAPDWANAQREGLERLADIIEWWIDNRTIDSDEYGTYGGGWGDDCEMWRFWVPTFIAFDSPKIAGAQEHFSKALLGRPHMELGYSNRLSDVQHSAEDSSDTLTPMMLLHPDDEEWSQRALKIADLMRNLWMGENERGFLQFKSTYIASDRLAEDARRACGTVYHAKAAEPVLLYWQRTRDPELTKLFTRWMDTWVDVTAREERGKPAGIMPSAIHWPDGRVGGTGEHWWDPENHTDDPLYVWPSSMRGMLNAMLLTYHMTGDEKYLEPIRSMARIRLGYLENPPEESPEPGSKAWCARRLGFIQGVVAKYTLLTGSTEFNALLEKDAGPYTAYRLYGNRETLTNRLQRNAEALSINFPGYTSEVRYTDRVLRFPHLLQANGMYPEAVPGIEIPDPDVLYASATGDPGDVEFFPMNAVRWLTPPRDIAALVVDSTNASLEAELFHFGSGRRPMGAEFYLLKPGKYVLAVQQAHQTDAGDTIPFAVTGARGKVAFELPAKALCRLTVEKAE